jgi:hypothetical protein
MLQEDIGNKCDVNLQNAGGGFSAVGAAGAVGGIAAERLVSYICINNSGIIRKY